MENQTQSTEKSKYRLYWERQKQKGLLRYCLVQGLYWGFLLGVVVQVFHILTRNESFDTTRLFTSIFVGFVFAPLMWYVNDKIIN
ncbi:MAG: hypothetical protein EAZ44_06120 [Cytophagia bacterium]|nr:MAG: hypothetical protein EAZ44_06120 [Cytophagia bacterium]TAG42764.1 MAG: hypothetical protein EAZ31_05520 [Cytophagia bacterium]